MHLLLRFVLVVLCALVAGHAPASGASLRVPEETPLISVNNALRCSACRLTAEQIMVELDAVDDKASIKMGGRMQVDDAGRVSSGKKIRAGRSEIFLDELLEGVCEHLEDFTHTGWRDGFEYFAKTPVQKAYSTKINTVSVDSENALGARFLMLGVQRRGGEELLLRKLCDGIVEDRFDDLLDLLTGNWTPVAELKLPHLMCRKMSRVCTKKKLGYPREEEEIATEAAKRDKESERLMKEAQ
jgi:hypothetical protein